MVPTLFGSSVSQINLLFDTVIASLLISGSQTWLSQADRFLELPLGVFGVALGTVILPSLSRHHVATDHEGFSKALDWGLRTTLLIAVPAMFGLMLLGRTAWWPRCSRTVSSRPFDTRMATLSVTALSFGVPAYAQVKVLLPAFYARQDTRTPVRAGVAALITNMLLNGVFLLLLYAMWAPPALKAGPLLDGLSQSAGAASGAGHGECGGQLHQSAVAVALVGAGEYLSAPAGLAASSDPAGARLRGDDGGACCSAAGTGRIGRRCT